MVLAVVLADRVRRPRAELGALEMESLIGMDPPEHTRMRRLVAYAFTARRVEALRSRVAGIGDDLPGAMEKLARPADLVEHFSTPCRSQEALDGFRWGDRRAPGASR